MFLLQSNRQLKLKQPANKVLEISTAINNTFVFITVSNNINGGQQLVHVDQNGQIIWSKHYQNSLDTFGMLNNFEVIVMNVTEHKIEVINLFNHTIRLVPHHYQFEDTSYMRIQTFHDSQYFCIIEKGSVGDKRLFLTYYHFAEQIDKISNISVSEYSYGCSINKLNNHSQIGWYNPKVYDQLTINICDLKNKREGIVYKINSNSSLLKQTFNFNNLSFTIASMWEIHPNAYLLTCKSNLSSSASNNIKINNNFILDVGSQSLRLAKFQFEDDWNQNLIQFFNMGSVSAFFTFKYQKGKALSSPVYFIKNSTEEIIARDQWNCSSNQYFYVPGFQNDILIQASHQNGEVEQVQIKQTRLVRPKQISMYLLLHLNEDFDDDLLKDAIDLLQV